MNLRIVFKFKDCKLQFYEKRRLFSYFSVNPRTPASRQRRLLKLKRKKINSFKIIIGFFFTSPLFLATKVAISFVYYSQKTIKCTQKPEIEKKVKRNRPIERANERVPFPTSYLQLALAHARNSRVKNDIDDGDEDDDGQGDDDDDDGDDDDDDDGDDDDDDDDDNGDDDDDDGDDDDDIDDDDDDNSSNIK